MRCCRAASVVGAYTFKVRPGAATTMDVDAALFPRAGVMAYGIAPLTSMFLFDATNRDRFDDFRAAVHDSDGLEIVNGGGERIWRPLANPRVLQVSAFLDNNPQGFGLVQRKRRFEDYQDYEARYDQRPSVWVEPRGEWGRGARGARRDPVRQGNSRQHRGVLAARDAARGRPARGFQLSPALDRRAARRIARARRRRRGRARRPTRINASSSSISMAPASRRRPRDQDHELGRNDPRRARSTVAVGRLPSELRARDRARRRDRASAAAVVEGATLE